MWSLVALSWLPDIRQAMDNNKAKRSLTLSVCPRDKDFPCDYHSTAALLNSLLVILFGMMNRRHIPAFGNWDYCNDLPITQYFESAMQAGLIRGKVLGEDADLFKVPAAPVKPAHHQQQQDQGKVKKEGEKQCQKGQERKQGKVCHVTAQTTTPRKPRAPKAVDEDLYKIPPELLYQKPKRKRLLRSLWSGCIGV